MIPNLASRDPWGQRETTWKTWSRRIKTSIGSFLGKTPIGFLGFQCLGSFLLNNSKWAKRRNPWNSWEQCDQPELWAAKQNVPQAQGGLCFPHNTFQAPGTEGHCNTGCSLENISTCVCFTTDNITHLTSSLHQYGQWRELPKQKELLSHTEILFFTARWKCSREPVRPCQEICAHPVTENTPTPSSRQAGLHIPCNYGEAVSYRTNYGMCLPNVVESHFSAIKMRMWPLE